MSTYKCFWRRDNECDGANMPAKFRFWWRPHSRAAQADGSFHRAFDRTWESGSFRINVTNHLLCSLNLLSHPKCGNYRIPIKILNEISESFHVR